MIAFPVNNPLMFSAFAAIIAATSESVEKFGARKSVGITPYLGYTESTNSKPLDLLVFVSYPPIISFFVTLLGSTELNLILSLALLPILPLRCIVLTALWGCCFIVRDKLYYSVLNP